MNVLVLNSGSSSLKFKFFNAEDNSVLSYGEIKNHSDSSINSNIDGKEEIIDISYWGTRFEILEKALAKNKVDSVLHRVVHGGELYVLPVVIKEDLLDRMKSELFDLAPLHNPFAFEIIDKSIETFGDAMQIVVFDSAFGMTMPEVNYLYGLPYEYYKKYKIRRFAFHGLSHRYVSKLYHNHISDDEEVYSDLHSQDAGLNDIRIVSLHLGSGSSTCAIKGTQCVDTSFGFTPEENLVMATRVGEIDYSAVVYIKNKESLSDKDISDMLNKKSGLLGISGYTKDMKTIVKDYNTNPRAKLALDIYVNDVVKQTFNMVASLNGIDVLIFTGGIGQASDIVRSMICERLGIFGVYIDVDKNKTTNFSNGILNVTKKKSEVDVVVIQTDEEKEMLEESISLLI
ncbi:MAG: acetate/propionate family kinase [Candidatus Dojkabacteria bacterium]